VGQVFAEVAGLQSFEVVLRSLIEPWLGWLFAEVEAEGRLFADEAEVVLSLFAEVEAEGRLFAEEADEADLFAEVEAESLGRLVQSFEVVLTILRVLPQARTLIRNVLVVL
jgi:hypothetical protein